MCGICGFVGYPEEKDLLGTMLSTLVHRGPDDNGTYIQPGIALGHTRLSIIDLTTGHQPIHNEDNTLWIVFNGEIYNYLELREDLIKKGHRFYTQSDTEVIIHLYEEEGEDFVKHLNGEFAIALWDVPRQKLVLARDRLGIRPLYYYSKGELFLFGSEIKALIATGIVDKKLDYNALDRYITLRYVPGKDTLFRGLYKLPPASLLVYQETGFRISSYWRLDYHPKIAPPRELEEEFYHLLEDSVRRRLMSEVPLGALLSGGLDSSTIVALMARHSHEPVRTFSIGFGTDIDELEEARAMANHLGCEHQELIVKKQDYQLLPKILWHMDEPLGDAIIIPTYILAEATARRVKVVLTGEGADEILGGYVHQLTMHLGHGYGRLVPEYIQYLNLNLLKLLPLKILERLFPYPAKLGVKGKTKFLNYLSHLQKKGLAYLDLAGLFSPEEKQELFTPDFLDLLRNQEPLEKELDLYLNNPNIDTHFLNRVIELDLNHWLPNYTLFKQDRLTMAHSLEGRVPFLDHRLVEFCAHVPASLKLQGLTTKYLLRKAAERLLPEKTAWGKKKSFYIPTEKCFDEKFSNFLHEILDPSAIRKRGIFNWRYIERLLYPTRSLEFLDNKRLMTLLILELWFKIFIDVPPYAFSDKGSPLKAGAL